MDQPKTSDRGVTLLKFVLNLLRDKPEGLAPREIYPQIEATVPLDSFDKEPMKGSGLPRWRATLHFHSVAATKAGLLVKSDGRWHVTGEGVDAARLPENDLKKLIRSRYREWRWGGSRAPTLPDDVDKPGTTDVAPAQRVALLLEDVQDKARAEIEAHLDTLDGFEFQGLVAALLEAMGYTPRLLAKPGPDGGTDILAYLDPLGARTPHIRVQVKHREQPASREEVAALRGLIRGDREIGLFVSSSGFTREAKREANAGAVHIEIVELDRFLELWIQHYDKIAESARAKLRLQPVYFLAPAEQL